MTSATTPKTVELSGDGIQHEAIVTNAAVTPGMLVTRSATGVRPHNVATATATPAFALENGAVGRGIDDTYAVGDQCIYKVFAPGSVVYATIKASAAAIVVGDFLTSAGNGTLEKAGTDDVVVAQARDALDNSSNAAIARLRVEIIPAQRTAPA